MQTLQTPQSPPFTGRGSALTRKRSLVQIQYRPPVTSLVIGHFSTASDVCATYAQEVVVLASRRLNRSETLSIELIEPDTNATVVRIVWPSAPTITTRLLQRRS
jgi:hypothetical protein